MNLTHAISTAADTDAVTTPTHMPPEDHPTAGRCRHCGAVLHRPWVTYRLEDSGPWTHNPLDECPACEDRQIEKRKAALAAERGGAQRAALAFRTPHDRFEARCPVEFRQSFRSDLLAPAGHVERALSWGLGAEPGLILRGDAATGKSRLAWEVIRRLHLDEQVEFAAIRIDRLPLLARQHAAEIRQADGYRAEADYQLHLATVPLLFIDDFGRYPAAPAVIGAAMAVLSERMDYARPTIIATRLMAKTLVKDVRHPAVADIIDRIQAAWRVCALHRPTMGQQGPRS